MRPSVEKFLRLRPLLHEVREEDGWLIATLDFQPAKKELLDLLKELHTDGILFEIRRDGTLVFPSSLGSQAHLDLRIDTGHLPGYFESYETLVRTHPDVPPNEYTVWNKAPDIEAGYAAACRLLDLLKSKAEVWDGTGQRLFFVDQYALEIPLTSYSAKETIGVPEYLEEITRFLDKGHLDADVRWAFFRKAAMRFLRDATSENRLGLLMRNLKTLIERAQQDHSLYLERFSFEDLLKNFDEKRLKFVGDLNQVLAAIQTALIAVPIGFFLIAEKFKPTTGLLGQNIILATGGLVFFALLFVLSLNQGRTLNAVRLSLTDFETEQRKKITDKTDRLEKLLKTTWEQLRRVNLLLWIVRILLIIFSAIVALAFLWCSLPSWQRFMPYTK